MSASMRSGFAIPFTLSLLATVAVGLGLKFGTPVAVAADPKSCMNAANPGWPLEDDYGQVGGHELVQDNGAAQGGIRGTRAKLYINKGASCQRIQGVHVLSPTGNGQFEFAYIRGWWGPSSCNGVDHNHFYTKPTLFNVRIDTNGSYGCKFWPAKHPTPGNWEQFRASDVNANTYFGSWWKGQELQPNGIDLSFSAGHGAINMERGGSNDSGLAKFNNVQEYRDANGWTNFDHLGIYYDHDVDYDLHTPDGHTGRIRN